MNAFTPPAGVDRTEWLAALGETRDPPPALHPDVLLAGDATRIRVLRAGDPPSVPAIAFFESHPLWLVRLPGLARLGRIEALTLLGDRVLGRADADRMGHLAELAARSVTAGDVPPVLFGGTEVDAPLWAALRSTARSFRVIVHLPTLPQPRWYVDLPKTAEEYWGAFSAKSRKNLRRAADAFEHQVRRTSDVQEVPALLRDLVRVSRNSWQGRRLGVRFCDDEPTRRRMESLAAVGALRSYVLDHSGQPVAFVFGTQYGGCYSFEETAFDSTFAAASPGRILCYRLLQDLLTEGTPARLDFGAGDADYKRFFGNRCTTAGPVLIARRSPALLLSLKAAAALQAVETLSRRAVRDSRVYRAVRNRFRR